MKIHPKRRAAVRFLLFHLLAAVAVGLFPLYRYAVGLLPRNMTGCILHDWCLLYCPLCGGTRAVSALFRFRFAEAFAANAYVTLLAAVVLVHVVVAWVVCFAERSGCSVSCRGSGSRRAFCSCCTVWVGMC